MYKLEKNIKKNFRHPLFHAKISKQKIYSRTRNNILEQIKEIKRNN